MPPVKAKPKLPPLPVEWVRLDDLLAAESNPKRHDIDTVCASIRRHGYVDHGVLDLRTGRLVGGHGRHDSLEAMRQAGENPDNWPCAQSNVHVDANGYWWVPSSITTTTDQLDAEHLLLSLNSGDRPGWDPDGLRDLLSRQLEADQLPGTGYDDDDVAKMIANETDPPLPSTDEIDLDTRYEVVITCASETDQIQILEQIQAERPEWEVRAIVA
jgi:hypothetical protein